MTKRQATKMVEQLRIALEVLFLNISPEKQRLLVKVEYKGDSSNFKVPAYLYHIKAGSFAYWDTQKIAREIEKILPNVRVTESFVFFFSYSIRLICKELGKKGTYIFDFVQVRS